MQRGGCVLELLVSGSLGTQTGNYLARFPATGDPADGAVTITPTAVKPTSLESGSGLEDVINRVG